MELGKEFKDGYFFREFLEIKESLNSPVNIYKTENDGNYSYYYFNINDKEFRAVIEKVQDESAIIFEQKINSSFSYDGIVNNLSSKEVLSLFSTLKSFLYYIKTEKNYIFTNDEKKLNVYLKIIKSISEIKSINYEKVQGDYVIGFSFDSKIITEPKNVKNKFKGYK